MSALLALALALASPQAARPAPPPTGASAATADAAFLRLKALAGTWRNADNPASALRIRFSLTAGGTVLVEEWLRGTEPHSLTLYHRDGAALVATHYCPQGNQPRLVLAWVDGAKLHFAFRDASDLDGGESHLHNLAFDLTNPAKPVRSEIYRDATGDEASRVRLIGE